MKDQSGTRLCVASYHDSSPPVCSKSNLSPPFALFRPSRLLYVLFDFIFLFFSFRKKAKFELRFISQGPRIISTYT